MCDVQTRPLQGSLDFLRALKSLRQLIRSPLSRPFHQTELTLRLGLKVPFKVDYGRYQQLFYLDRLFERPHPTPSHLTVVHFREPLPSGSGPFIR